MRTFIKHQYLLLCLCMLGVSAAKAQDQATTSAVTSINLALVMPPVIDGISGNDAQLLSNKIINMLTNEGMASDDQDKTFIITPAFNVTGVSSTAGTMRKVVIANCSFSLFIKQGSTKTIFSTYTKAIAGTGTTKEEAITSAVTQITADEAGIQKFLAAGKAKIGAYYQANCAQFMAKADQEIAQNHFDAARTILSSFPQESGQCYTDAQAKMGVVFAKQYGSIDKAAATFRQENIINPGNAAVTKNLAIVQNLIAVRTDQDKTPPVINLITPAVTRGQVIEADVKNNNIYVSGTAKDPSGIASVSINGKDVPALTEDGFFQTNISKDETDVVVKATDKKGNAATLTYHITAKTATTQTSSADIAPIAATEKFHAIFMANSDYSGATWPALPTTVSEAHQLMKLLEAQYHFDPANVDTVFNKGKRDMCKALLAKVSKLGPDDNLIIYYGGHGKFDMTKNLAYWVPLDATDEVDYISNTEINDILAGCNAKHVLIMADACFSGAMRGGVDAPPNIENISKSRQMLTSGGTEPVPGVSVYVKQLLDKLNSNTDHFMSARDLQARIYPGIKNEGHTECSLQALMIAGSEGGQFYFKKN